MQFPCTIEGIRFPTKISLEKHIRAIALRCGRNDVVSTDLAFLLEFFKSHPRSQQKIGSGVRRMWLKWKTASIFEFWIERPDGSKTDISWTKTITPPSKLKDFTFACRAAINADKVLFRNSRVHPNGYFISDLSGQKVRLEDVHVDHAPPNTFDVIQRAFIERYNIDVDKVELDYSDEVRGCVFVEKWLEKLWKTFHNKRVRFRILTQHENLSTSRRGAQ